MSSGKRSRSSSPSTSGSTVAQKVGKKPGRGIRLTSQTKYIIDNVQRFYEEEKKTKRLTLRDRTAKATGVSKQTVTNIHKTMTQEKYFLTPTKRYIASRVHVNVD